MINNTISYLFKLYINLFMTELYLKVNCVFKGANDIIFTSLLINFWAIQSEPLRVKIKDSFGVDVYDNVLVFKQFVVLRFSYFYLD